VPTWPDQIRHSAGVDPDEEPSPYLSQLSRWHRQTRAAAAGHSRHATKRAVQEVDPRPEERRALMALFALQAETIYWVCSDVLSRYARSGHADEPSLELEDLLAEAYPLFLRALVRYEGDRPLEIHVRRAFRGRVEDYVESRLRHPAPIGPDGAAPDIPDTSGSLPDVDIGAICKELQEEGVVPELGAGATPDDG